EDEIFQDLLKPSESSNDKTNVVNLPQEPFVFNQDPGENSSQSPPHINHHCGYECGDSLDDIFCQRCTCKSCGNGAHYGYNYPLKVSIISNPEPCNNQTVDELPQTSPSFPQQYPCCEDFGSPHETFQCQPMNYYEPNPCYDSNYSGFDKFQPPQYIVDHPIFNAQNELLNSQNEIMEQMTSICDMILICYDYDDDEESSIPLKDIIISGLPPCVTITPILLTEEPVNSLIMEDEHLDTILEMESDKVIKSSVENLVPIPSEFEGISDSMCHVPFCDNSTPLEVLKDHSEIFINSNDDDSSSDDNSLYGEDIDYVEASPLDSELVSLEVVEIVIPEVRGIDTDILLTIKYDILSEKLLNVNLLIDKIEALKDNPIPSSSISLNFFLEETNTFDNSLPESETFCFNLEEISSGSPTSYLDLSLPDYEAFFCDSEPDSGNFTMDVVEDIFDNPTREPRVHVLSDLPTPFSTFSFPSGTRNKIFDPGIFIEVQSKRFLSPNEFSISFMRDPLSPVFNTLLPFSSENEDKVFNPGILASNEETSPHLLSHRGFNPSKIISDFSESPMMISGGDIPILDVEFLHFYPP
ncbi:hypothetical protein Tco_1242834, partial [Tanacetum coccineum]